MNEHTGTLYLRVGNRVRTLFRRVIMTCLAFMLASIAATGNASLPAFPGAEGAGALAVGGRGGSVCRVTNLNDSGPGTLRECIDKTGPRIVIFAVGGTISLERRLSILNPYITISGQTAPGGGIQIKASENWSDGNRASIEINTHDVVIRFLKLRRGKTYTESSNVAIADWQTPVYNVILDHVSMAWSENQNWGAWGYNSSIAPKNITLQYSILTEMLDRVNLLTGSNRESPAEAMTDIDFHNNILLNTKWRNPLLKHASGRWINNIVYNWTGWASRTAGGVYADFVSNFYKPGPADKRSTAGMQEIQFVEARYWEPGWTIKRDPSLYVVGNRGLLSGMDPETDNWPYTREAGPQDGDSVIGPTPTEWRRDTPLPTVGVPITVRHADELEDHLLPIVGASKRLDCGGKWISNRDEADTRAIEEYLANEGRLISNESEVGGHPVIAAGAPCIDSSGDGVPDEWAINNGLDPADASLGGRLHDSGYTYLELYLNGVQIGRAPPEVVPNVRVD